MNHSVCFNPTSLRPLYRQHLLVHTARTEGYGKLMLGDHCTRLAVKLLSSISLGRGAQLAQDTVCYGNMLNPIPMFTFAFTNHLMISNVLYCSCLCQQGFSDSRFGDIVIVKPMRDYSAKEIAYYNRMFSVPSVFIPSLETKVSLNIRTPTEWFKWQQIILIAQ